MDLREMSPGAANVRHPWETARLSFFAERLGSVVGTRPHRVLDVGAGDGFAATQLATRFPQLQVTCIDTGYAQSGFPVDSRVRFLERCPEEQFDIITLLDVLEHVEDEGPFLSGLVRDHLRPGGHALVSVPAWPELFTQHDRFLGHYRRYRPQEFRERLTSAGLEWVEGGGLFHSLLAPRALAAAAERLKPPAADERPATLGWNRGALVTGTVNFALRCDNFVSAFASRLGIGLPGLSTWALARRPE